MEKLDPEIFELPASTILQKVSDNLIAVIKIRKSRIIMRDGEKLLETARKIREKMPDSDVIIKTTAPVCSKTEQFLRDNNVRIEKSEIAF